MDVERADRSETDWPARLAEQARANERLLFSLAHRVLKDRTAAEDACQKALLSAWMNRHEIAEPNRIKGWLATAVINESLSVLRRKRVEHKAFRLVAVGGAVTSKIDKLHQSELGDAIMSGLADLEDAQRTVVTLRLMHAVPGHEVASMLGISDGQVSKLLHRGMEQLRIALAEWNETPNK